MAAYGIHPHTHRVCASPRRQGAVSSPQAAAGRTNPLTPLQGTRAPFWRLLEWKGVKGTVEYRSPAGARICRERPLMPCNDHSLGEWGWIASRPSPRAPGGEGGGSKGAKPHWP